jgi:hypothetical protein
MLQPQKTTPPTVQRADAPPIDADVAQRERRYRRAIAGWLAGGMRARARERQRGRGDGPARAGRTVRVGPTRARNTH